MLGELINSFFLSRPQPNQQQQQHQQAPPQDQRPDERQKSPTPQPPPPTKMKEDSIEKIKKIQADVLALMDQVEHFEATGRDKRYMYLDEMLTQNLLKLDTVDTEGKDNIKLARREAIKCINHCISVLEAKVDASEELPANNHPGDSAAETHDSQPVDKKSASADNVLKNAEQSAEIKKSSSQK
jgi:BCL2-associated athanogene 3